MADQTFADYIRWEGGSVSELLTFGAERARQLEDVGAEITSVDLELGDDRHNAIEINFDLTESQALAFGYSRAELDELKENS